MAKRFRDTSIWDEDWFLELTKEHKLLWTYICDNCDHAGIWKPNFKKFSLLIECTINVKDFLKAINEEKERIIVLKNSRWLLTGFISFQYGDKLNCNNKFHRSIYNLLVLNEVNLTSLRPQVEVLESTKVKVKVKDKETDILESSTKEEIGSKEEKKETEQERKDYVYLPLENANAYKLQDLYANTAGFKKDSIVLCDVYTRVRHRGTGKRAGMPVLYYKADTSKTAHNLNNPDDPDNIYNYRDNHELLGLGVPWDPNEKHPLFTNPKIFYEMTKNRYIRTQSIPHNADSFILISAGYDGLYGTKDDIVNFAE